MSDSDTYGVVGCYSQTIYSAGFPTVQKAAEWLAHHEQRAGMVRYGEPFYVRAVHDDAAVPRRVHRDTRYAIERSDTVNGPWEPLEEAHSSYSAWATVVVYRANDVRPTHYRVVVTTTERDAGA